MPWSRWLTIRLQFDGLNKQTILIYLAAFLTECKSEGVWWQKVRVYNHLRVARGIICSAMRSVSSDQLLPSLVPRPSAPRPFGKWGGGSGDETSYYHSCNGFQCSQEWQVWLQVCGHTTRQTGVSDLPSCCRCPEPSNVLREGLLQSLPGWAQEEFQDMPKLQKKGTEFSRH